VAASVAGASSQAASVGTAAAATTAAFEPTADARVHEATPTTNYGVSSSLRTDLSLGANVESLLRFTVTGLQGSVQSARLRLYAYTTTTNGPAVYASAGGWVETTVTWSNRPAHTGAAVADSSAIPTNSWVEFDVTSLVTGDGTYNFALIATSGDGIDFYSRQSGNVTLRPRLVVETVATGPPLSTSPPTTAGTAQEGQTLTASPGTWAGTQPIAYAYAWHRCDALGGACAPIAGATAQSYELGSGDVGSTLRVGVTATNEYGSATATSAASGTVSPLPPPGDPVIVAAGDIAGCAYDEDEATAQLIDAIAPTRVITLGDNAYENGTDADFANCYHPTWGRHKAITNPSPGNHEYYTPGATGYFNYFGAAAGDPARGYYAFDLGSWRLYALNSNCSDVPCGTGSAQEQWLRADLAANPRSCKLAYMHHPRFASGTTEDRRNNTTVAALYRAFYEASGDLWLVGHNHTYERLTRLDPSGAIDLERGVRNFVVGTGGTSLYAFGTAVTGSELRENTTRGVLRLTLGGAGYSWTFVPIAGRTFRDSGTDGCAGATTDTSAPSQPANLVAPTPSATQVDLSWTASSDNVGVVAYDVHRGGILLATTTTTSYSDGSVVGGTTYAYSVTARDAAGNVSPASNTATATPGVGTATSAFAPTADARVHEAQPTTNYGTSSSLRTDTASGGNAESVIRFTVAGLAGPVQSARLRLYAYNGTANGPAVYAAGNDWAESTVTWSSRPARTSALVADSGAIPSGTWVEFDVTSLVGSDGTYSFAVVPTSADGVDFYSRQSKYTTLRPELVVATGFTALGAILRVSMTAAAPDLPAMFLCDRPRPEPADPTRH
jgi:hypothetical protein